MTRSYVIGSQRKHLSNLQYAQTPLSQNSKTLSSLLIAFLQCPIKLAHFENKDQLHNFNILEVNDSEKCNYLSARKLLF